MSFKWGDRVDSQLSRWRVEMGRDENRKDADIDERDDPRDRPFHSGGRGAITNDDGETIYD